MSLINCSNPQCQTTVGCICEKQLKPMTTTPKLEPCELVLEARKMWWEIVESDKGECRMMGIVRELADEVERLRAAPSAGLREALELLQGFLSCPEIADCAPEDKDPETDDLERRARALTLSKED